MQVGTSLPSPAKLLVPAAVEAKLTVHAVLNEAGTAHFWLPKEIAAHLWLPKDGAVHLWLPDPPQVASFSTSRCSLSRSSKRSLRLRVSTDELRDLDAAKRLVAGGGVVCGLASFKLRPERLSTCWPRCRARAPARSKASKSSSGIAVWQSK